jgi:hypothetical protein
MPNPLPLTNLLNDEIAKAGIAAAGSAAAFAVQYSTGPAEALNPINDLTFPPDLINDKRNYYLQLQFMTYKKGSPSQTATVTPNAQQGLIRLPIPNNLVNTSSIHYDEPTLGPVVGAVLDVATNSNNGVDQFGEIGTAIAAELSQSVLGGTVSAASSLYNGNAFNPYQAVLFKSPNFRSHSFSWKLIPSEAKESDIIKKIIDLLHYNMHPGIEFINSLFTFPSVVYVNLYPNSEYLYKFKPCVITSLIANYAPQNTPAFYRKSNAPAAIDLTINLQEIELWTRNDYKSINPVLPQFS